MKSRRIFLKQGALASAALLVAKPFTSFGMDSGFFPLVKTNANSVTILHTNDLHNQLGPLSHNIYSNMGGFDKASGMIARIKQQDNNVLLVDAGDIFCGNMHNLKNYETTLQMMQAAGYDAALLGNRDYEASPDYLQEQWQKNNVSLVASNYSYKERALKNLHQPYKIVQKGNIKIGIIAAGINLKELLPANLISLIQYTDPVKELSAIAKMLKQDKKCQLVICLSHLGYKNEKAIDDIKFASLSTNIDVIIGGHSHTFMQAPQIVLNQQQEEVIVNHAGFGGMVLGNMNISFDDDGNKRALTFNNLLVGAKDNAWSKIQYAGVTLS
jgi:5'-nucleotidase